MDDVEADSACSLHSDANSVFSSQLSSASQRKVGGQAKSEADGCKAVEGCSRQSTQVTHSVRKESSSFSQVQSVSQSREESMFKMPFFFRPQRFISSIA